MPKRYTPMSNVRLTTGHGDLVTLKSHVFPGEIMLASEVDARIKELEAERDRSKADRDQALQDVIDMKHNKDKAYAFMKTEHIKRKAAEASLSALWSGLERYGRHENHCGCTFDHATQTGELIQECTCGLDALLSSVHGPAKRKE